MRCGGRRPTWWRSSRSLPPPSLADERERVRRRVRLAALALAEATAGVVTDDGGFEVDRYTL
ncbi:hypothetical protein GCM10025868_24970 [Angustibacter aerolatus]|uniref:Uncharacterized protein n=1 Tax=Angustibacter aerolatus TaxID=1162965 RepID=A0ABQ6JHM9_9ACTN|nr:hypothetical protein GCM10025868_24970 [Angustibacter aerolatus]